MTLIVLDTPGQIKRQAVNMAVSEILGADSGFCGGHDTPHCALIAERHASALREQFIGVLGHDLRNPLSAIISGMDIISRSPLDERQTQVSKLVQSSAARMSALIDDVLDFARRRLGDGMSLTREAVLLGPIILQVIDELRSSQPTRRLTTDIDQPNSVECDPGRLSQLLSNLTANALVHGSSSTPVGILAYCDDDGTFVLSVSNRGDPIPEAAIARLFQPFTRDEIRPYQHGLGLGLFIAAEIAHTHGGTLQATSTLKETRFTFQMPLKASEITRLPS